MKFVLQRASYLIALLLLSACASTGPAETDVIPPRPARDSITSFELGARAVIRTPTRGDTVRIQWQHAAAEDAIGFATPLGNVLAELQRDALGARWLTADGERYDARSADLLMARLTDVPVPLDSLALWVTGRVGGKAIGIQRDAMGRLVSATDDGWSITIATYESELPNALPRSVEAARDGLRIRLAIESWTL